MSLTISKSIKAVALIVAAANLYQPTYSQCTSPIAPTNPWPHDGNNLVQNSFDPAWNGLNNKVLLDANFNSKTINNPIGEGGAANGEPVYVETPTIITAVRSLPFDSPCLEIKDNDTYAGGSVWFEFLDNQEIATGTIILSADIAFTEDNLYFVYVREAGSATRNFADIYLRPGNTSFFYGTGTSFTCKTNTRHPMIIVFHMNERTMDFWFDGKTMFVNKPMSVLDRGVGSILFGTEHDADKQGTMYVDNVHVSWDGNCPTKFNVYMGETTPPTTLVASQLDHPFLTSVNRECNKRYYWRVDEINTSGNSTGQIWNFTSERCACEKVILEANFDTESANSAPDLSLPGDPVGDYAWMGEIGGTIRVMQDPITLANKHAVFNRIAGSGSVDMRFSPNVESASGIVHISARVTPFQDNQSAFGIFARDHLGRVPFALAYIENNKLLWNNRTVLSARYQSYQDQLIDVELNYITRSASLSINGIPIPEIQDIPFEDPLASDFNWFHVGTGSTWSQSFAFDDLRVCVESCCQGMRGNVNGDANDQVNVIDVTYLVNYLFKNGPIPPCIEEANVNGDVSGVVNITDLTYLVGYLFRGGNVPVSCVATMAATESNSSKETRVVLACSKSTSDSGQTLRLNSSEDLLGIEIHLEGNGEFDAADYVPAGLEVFSSSKNGSAIIGILDVDGSSLLQSSNDVIARIPQGYTVVNATASTVSHQAAKVEVQTEPFESSLPKGFELNQNYPNPFNPSTQISFSLPSPSNVILEIFNTLGQNVRTLLNDRMDSGGHTVEWNGRSDQNTAVASGVYYYRLITQNGSMTKKMTLLK